MTTSDGTQAIRRAASILQRIARVTGDSAPTLPEIAASEGLSRSTAHRILKCLVETDLAAYDSKTRRYEIGLLSYELGLAATAGAVDLAHWSRRVENIAHRTEATTYLMRRSGVEAVCIYKADGTSLVRVAPVKVGQRRYLGVGAGATALLAALDDNTVERTIAAIASELSQFSSLSPDTILASVSAVRQSGFAVSRGQVYSSVFGLGVAIPRLDHPAELAVSIAAHQADVSEPRIRAWKQIISEELGLQHEDKVVENSAAR